MQLIDEKEIGFWTGMDWADEKHTYALKVSGSTLGLIVCPIRADIRDRPDLGNLRQTKSTLKVCHIPRGMHQWRTQHAIERRHRNSEFSCRRSESGCCIEPDGLGSRLEAIRFRQYRKRNARAKSEFS